MSTDNHDQTKPCVSKPPARIELNADESAFDGRRIKKERTDVSLENGDGINAGINNTNKQQLQSSHRPAAGRFSNGFHDDDLLQDIIAAKFTALANHGTTTKYDKIRLMIEDSISEESKARIQEVFSQIEQLKIEERLLLYLKLPLSLTNTGGTVDPLRQPLNPLGNRYEIHQTIMWIKTHLEEDPDVSLPKQEVYDEYNMYCMRNSMKPLSTADFGKVMKQVYPRVRPRRLGTRGNSRYCYAGMRKRVKLDPPALPNISGTQTGDEVDENITEEMLGAASTLIREWAENLLGLKFPTLSALARHLVDNLCVDTRSLSAVCILCASGNSNTATNKESNTDIRATSVSGKSGKLREAQLQLQRKLQQREHIRDQKHRHLDAVIQNQNKEKTVDNKAANKGNRKAKSNQSSQGTNVSSGQNALSKLNSPAIATNRQRKVLKAASSQPCNISLESNCDNIVVQSIEDVQNNSNPSVVMTNCVNTQRDVKPKNSRKRANPIVLNQPSETSPEKQTNFTEQQIQENVEHSNVLPKLTSIQRPGKISVILASNLKPTKCKTNEAVNNQPTKNCDNESSTCSKSCIKVNGCPTTFESNTNATEESNATVLTKDQILLLQENSNLAGKTEKLGSIDSDALDDYLNGGNNSQEQEEELLQYFQQSNSSSSDVEANTISIDEQISRSDKVSQLRLILQQNLKGGTVHAPIDVLPAAIIRQNVEKREITQKHNLILPTLLNHPNPNNTRRRVSFETNVVEHVQDSNVIANTVPQSPNTRRRIFNFTPISPGPHSPINGRASKSNSANASPFVSPRNTPVPRSRSNLQASSSRARAHKSLSRSISCSMPYTSKNDTFVVPTSGPELVRQTSSTPQLPLISTKSSEVQVDSNTTQISIISKREGQGSQCAAFLSSDLAPQKQLVINYPSQENLQEIKNVYQKSQPDQEISELFHNNKQFTSELYRSQSVPLHRMVNPALMSPISTQHCLSSFQSQSFNPSTSSSVAPTPVPSEFNDFGSINQSEVPSTYLLDDVDPNFISDDQNFLMGDKEITPENITNILNILDEEGTQSLQILPDQSAEEGLIENNSIVLDALPNSNLNLSEEDMLDPSNVLDIPVGGALQKIIQSRSYPNTPLPVPVSTYTPSYTEDSNGSRSYPSTPLHTIQSQETYQDTNEPMLSSPTLNSLNLHNETVNESASSSLCRNVVDLLEANFLGETDTETNDLDPLGNFDGLQDVDSLTPLFNEVTEPNR
ncbi:DNA-binding protein RFX7 [Melipona quadrifasciata]|uniref:DNA-binding protein RFX7 n=1 Tax=Melipona quadrifasciata TaxID=166423 RepID=A0A0M9AD79_9HYME|nr:DNA-binding protein RFX7 [Melipona quadrifasciata]